MDKQEIEEVDKSTYLGSMTTGTGGTENEVKARIQKANAAFIQLHTVWRGREIPIDKKKKKCKSNVKSIIFACETRKSTKKILKGL
jgi:hypothetical protein